jgi:hypothetical protein
VDLRLPLGMLPPVPANPLLDGEATIVGDTNGDACVILRGRAGGEGAAVARGAAAIHDELCQRQEALGWVVVGEAVRVAEAQHAQHGGSEEEGAFGLLQRLTTAALARCRSGHAVHADAVQSESSSGVGGPEVMDVDGGGDCRGASIPGEDADAFMELIQREFEARAMRLLSDLVACWQVPELLQQEGASPAGSGARGVMQPLIDWAAQATRSLQT